MFVGYKGVAGLAKWARTRAGVDNTKGDTGLTAKGLIQYLVSKGLGSSWFSAHHLFTIFLPKFHRGRYRKWERNCMGGWVLCVVRFTIFYGFRGNLVWVAANSNLLLWQTVKLVFRQIVVLKVAVRKHNKIQCCSL